MKVILYLMTKKGYNLLSAIAASNYANMIEAVIVGRDKNLLVDYADEIVDMCVKHRIRHFERGMEGDIRVDYALAISWRWMIEKKEGTQLIVLHDSLLPKYRGFTPLVSALLNRDKKVGVTALFASDDYDKGEIVDQETLSVKYPIRIADAIEKVSSCYSKLVLRILGKISQETTMIGVAQDEKDATYSLWRGEDDYLIDWSNTSDQILNLIYVLSKPYKGAATYLGGRRLRIINAEIVPDVKVENRSAGKVIFIRDGCPVIVCGSGLIRLTEVLDELTGKSALPFPKFRSHLTLSPRLGSQ